MMKDRGCWTLVGRAGTSRDYVIQVHMPCWFCVLTATFAVCLPFGSSDKHVRCLFPWLGGWYLGLLFLFQSHSREQESMAVHVRESVVSIFDERQ
jgi:hypothetical protein